MNRKRLFLLIISFLIIQSGYRESIAQCYELVWAEEFNYTGFPDPAVWNMEVGNNNGNNHESQYYTKNDQDNCWVDSGLMTITALKENYGGQAYTSARINTKGKAEFLYGKIEARLKLPYGQGIWPAFWTLGKNISEVGWPQCGEIDIMELIGGADPRDRTSYGTPHWADANGNHAQYGGSKRLSSGKYADDFHIFSIEWTPLKIAWFVDGVQFHVMSTTPASLSEFHQEHFIILNLAVGGDWPGYPDATTVFPQKFQVDYVRVYQAVDNDKITGKDSVVSKENDLTFSLPALEGRQFKWSVPEGALIVSGADSGTVKVNWGCASGTINCTIKTSCSDSVVKSKLIKVFEPQIKGPLFFDKTAGNLFFSIPGMYETEYLWSIPEGAEFITDSTFSSIEVKWGTLPGEILLQYSNSCGTREVNRKIFRYGQYPFPDPEKPSIIPGTINSTDFDYGGEGVAYHDLVSRNQGGGPRQDEKVDTEDQPLFSNVGWILTGEWLEYSIKVPAGGYYKVSLKVGSQNTSNIGPIRILINGEQRTADIAVPSTGSWTSFTNVSQRLLPLYDTDTLLRIEAVNGGFNLGPMSFTVDNTVGVKGIDGGTGKIILYPNPASDCLNINLDFPVTGKVKINITDVTGKQLFSYFSGDNDADNQTITLTENIRQLKAGIYFVRISAQNQQFFTGFIKN